MTDVIKVIGNKIEESCLERGNLEKQGCEVYIDGTPEPRLVVDLDKPGSPLHRSRVRCDYLFFAATAAHSVWVVPIEMKSTGLKISGVVKQLRAGARAAQSFVGKGDVEKFRPVAAVSGGVRRAQLNELKKKKNQIAFYKHQESVRVMLCGNSLNGVI